MDKKKVFVNVDGCAISISADGDFNRIRLVLMMLASCLKGVEASNRWDKFAHLFGDNVLIPLLIETTDEIKKIDNQVLYDPELP